MLQGAFLLSLLSAQPLVSEVGTRQELLQALQVARPGSIIILKPGTYEGGIFVRNLHGQSRQPILIKGSDRQSPPIIKGGNTGIQISSASHVRLENLIVEGAKNNGINIDDGGKDTPSLKIELVDLKVRNIGSTDNQDGIKLSGVDSVTIENCTIENWSKGGSAIDMVGCHKSEIRMCTFRNGGSNAVQLKGGTSDILIFQCNFLDTGERSINIGGNTGLQFFRPKNAKYEAKNIVVLENLFVRGNSPIAFVGVDGARFENNTIVHPNRYAFQILQETREPGFVPSRNGVIKNNLIVWKSSWKGAVNVGSATAPETFKFEGNWWFCEDAPNRSTPKLPTTEKGGVYGKDPLFQNPAEDDFSLRKESPATAKGRPKRS